MAEIDVATRQAHRLLRFGIYWTEVAAHLVAWAVVAGLLALDGAVVVLGAIPVVALVAAGSERIAGGSVVRRAGGFRVVDRRTGGRPSFAGALLRQGGRLVTWFGAQTLVGLAMTRGYDDAQRRRSGTQVVGRPGPLEALAVAGVGAVAAAVGLAAGRAGSFSDDAWVAVAVAAVPFGVVGALLTLVAAVSLAGLPSGDDDAVSELGVVGEPVAIDPGLAATVLGAGMVGRGGYDPTPVARTRLDGTEAEVVPTTASFVTRKRRRTGELAPPS
jgi:hypothetical protein